MAAGFTGVVQMLVASPGLGSPSRKLAQFFRYGCEVDGLRWQLWMPSRTYLEPSSPWHGLARPGVLHTSPHPAPALLLLSDASDWHAAAKLYGRAPQLPRLHLLWGNDLRHWGHGAQAQPALRVAMGNGVGMALSQSGVFREAVHRLPMGLDPEDLPAPARSKSSTPVILARHQPGLGLALQRALKQRGVISRCELNAWPERQWHVAVSQAAVVVVLSPPPGQAGLGLRRLAAMALGAVVVCDEWQPDDGLCRDGFNALIRTANADDLANAVMTVLDPAGVALREQLIAGGKATLLRHRTALERLRFEELLEDFPEHWQLACRCHAELDERQSSP